MLMVGRDSCKELFGRLLRCAGDCFYEGFKGSPGNKNALMLRHDVTRLFFEPGLGKLRYG